MLARRRVWCETWRFGADKTRSISEAISGVTSSSSGDVYFQYSDEVALALSNHEPVVALETAVVTHGLPYPRNLEAVNAMESAIRRYAATPATCLINDGSIWIGAGASQIEAAARDPDAQKAGMRDIGHALAGGGRAGLTVSATVFVAHHAGIQVFATGGIGGVHFGAVETGDISADLVQIARHPVLVVCSGAKSVLDIPRTLELLETLSIPVLGYGVDSFPAFYLHSSGVSVSRVDTIEQIARIARIHWDTGNEAGLVVGNAIPASDAIEPDEWNGWLDLGLAEARESNIQGQGVTPFLLERVSNHSRGRTITANIALLAHNASVAAEIAVALSQ